MYQLYIHVLHVCLNSSSKNRCALQSELSHMDDRPLLHQAPLYCQPMRLTVPELDSANCPIQYLVLTNKIVQYTLLANGANISRKVFEKKYNCGYIFIKIELYTSIIQNTKLNTKLHYLKSFKYEHLYLLLYYVSHPRLIKNDFIFLQCYKTEISTPQYEY